MSATLPPDSLERLAQRWGRAFVGIRAGLGRTNLFLGVYPCESAGERLVRLSSLLRGLDPGTSAVVYCGTRRETDFVAAFLQGAGWTARAFHAGIPAAMKASTMAALRTGGI